MKSILTISAVVLLHAAALSVIGCRSTTGFHEKQGASAPTPPPEAAVAQTSTATIQPAQTTPIDGGSGIPASQWQSGVPTSQWSAQTPSGETNVALDLSPKPAQLTTDTLPATEAGLVGAGKTYTVKKGDSLGLIAKREGTTVKTLAAANGLKANTGLKEGQKIVVPASAGKIATPAPTAGIATAGATYVVKKGDTLGGIAKANGTSVSKIQTANKLTGANIREGQKLVIPGATIAAATPAAGTATAAALPIRAGAATTGTPAPAAPARAIGDMPAGGFGGFGISGTPAPAPAPAPAPTTAKPAQNPAEQLPVSPVNH